MRWWLSKEANVPFDAPEMFSQYDEVKGSCKEKLSKAIMDSVPAEVVKYSKATHTPRLLQLIDPNVVGQKCPLFRELYTYLTNFAVQDL